jgi:DNA-binding NarL/FixJ family response regulator
VGSRTAAPEVFCHDPLVSRRVLIVDDHPSFRASARALLTAAGFEVVGEATTGGEALAAVTALRPDIVLLDVQLPDMSGFDVCALLEREDGRPPDIVLVSSRDPSDYGDLVEASCACGFVPKGELSSDALLAVLP